MDQRPRANSNAFRLTCSSAIRLTAAVLALTLSAGVAVAATKVGTGKSFDYVGWDAYLGGQESSQFSALDQINKANVGQLEVAWTFQTGRGAPTFGPLVANGMMYVLAEGNALVALDPATGKEIWRKPQKAPLGSRGMNYWQSADGKDKRLLFLSGGRLWAVSADTGEPIATFGDGTGVDLRVGLEGDISKIRPLQTNNPGRIYKNLIIMSLPAGGASYDSSPADIHAYDVRTGKLVWVFHVVPRKGEFGADTWPDTDHEKFGGVHNWSESTVDSEMGIVFIPTGTARFDFYGGNRPGNNLFGNSLLALDARTGKRLWHYQTVHHDLWDFDLPMAPKLMTITQKGKKIPVVVQASKQGFIFVFDRRTGKPIWPIEERPVPQSDVPGEKTSPTQPFPTLPKPFARQSFTEADINPYIPAADQEKVREILRTYRNEGLFTPPSIKGTISMPGHNGGGNWGMAASDPVHQRFFVIARNLPVIIKLSPSTPRPGAAPVVMPNGEGLTAYQSPVDFMLQSNGFSAIGPPWSTITAYDMNSGQMLWQLPNGEVKPLADQGVKDTGSHIGRGAPVATGSGLLFNATSTDRKFRARDAETGKILWEHDLPAASEGIPAVYEASGRQFIVIPVGGAGLWAPKLDLPEAGPNQYIAFALPAGVKAAGAR